MRFDDSFETVLAAEMSTSFGAQAAWRQLVDLIGRGRTAATPEIIDRLRTIRDRVPLPVRTASSRALALAEPPAALIALFVDDVAAVSAPVLRSCRLNDDEWIALLPRLAQAGRAVLRHRRDLSPAVMRALAAYGPVDFVLHGGEQAPAPTEVAERPAPPREEAARLAPAPLTLVDTPDDRPAPEPGPEPAASPEDFVSIATVAMGLPVVAAALRDADRVAVDGGGGAPAPTTTARGPFEIADLVARIDAFNRQRESAAAARPATEAGPPAALADNSTRFRFETDAAGVIRWIAGAPREPVIGISLDLGRPAAGMAAGAQVDGVAGGAFRRRAPFTDARLIIMGDTALAGQWRMSGMPVFDRASGRFTGYRGVARRPRADERAEPRTAESPIAADSLRQLVHELRTPTTAIAGFAEMIDGQMLGPVPDAYRAYAGTIREQTKGLLGAIDDLDTAARLDVGALDLRPTTVAMVPVLRRVADDLASLASLRGATLVIPADLPPISARGDDRAIERLVGRLLAVLVAATTRGEQLHVTLASEGDDQMVLAIDRPAALRDYDGKALFSIDADFPQPADGAPLLGTGFALRLARNLARELGGSLTIAADRLTLRLPAAFTQPVDQASNN